MRAGVPYFDKRRDFGWYAGTVSQIPKYLSSIFTVSYCDPRLNT